MQNSSTLQPNPFPPSVSTPAPSMKVIRNLACCFFFFLIKKCQESLHPATNKQHAKNILYLFFLVVGIYIFFTWNREGGREKIFTPLGWGGVVGPTGFVQRGVKSTFINFYRWNRVILFLLVLSLFFFLFSSKCRNMQRVEIKSNLWTRPPSYFTVYIHPRHSRILQFFISLLKKCTFTRNDRFDFHFRFS